jgi:hypothetical protein
VLTREGDFAFTSVDEDNRNLDSRFEDFSIPSVLPPAQATSTENTRHRKSHTCQLSRISPTASPQYSRSWARGIDLFNIIKILQ